MPNTSKRPATDTSFLAAFGGLGVRHEIAQKSVNLLRFVVDNSAAATDAAKALKELNKSGVNSLGGVALGAASAAAVGASTEFAGEKYASLGFNLIQWSLNMGNAVTMTPGRASGYVAVAFSQKALALAGIASKSDVNECRVAIGKLAADVAVTALTWETGIGGILGVAGILLDGQIARQACYQ